MKKSMLILIVLVLNTVGTKSYALTQEQRDQWKRLLLQETNDDRVLEVICPESEMNIPYPIQEVRGEWFTRYIDYDDFDFVKIVNRLPAEKLVEGIGHAVKESELEIRIKKVALRCLAERRYPQTYMALTKKRDDLKKDYVNLLFERLNLVLEKSKLENLSDYASVMEFVEATLGDLADSFEETTKLYVEYNETIKEWDDRYKEFVEECYPTSMLIRNEYDLKSELSQIEECRKELPDIEEIYELRRQIEFQNSSLVQRSGMLIRTIEAYRSQDGYAHAEEEASQNGYSVNVDRVIPLAKKIMNATEGREKIAIEAFNVRLEGCKNIFDSWIEQVKANAAVSMSNEIVENQILLNNSEKLFLRIAAVLEQKSQRAIYILRSDYSPREARIEAYSALGFLQKIKKMVEKGSVHPDYKLAIMGEIQLKEGVYENNIKAAAYAVKQEARYFEKRKAYVKRHMDARADDISSACLQLGKYIASYSPQEELTNYILHEKKFVDYKEYCVLK